MTTPHLSRWEKFERLSRIVQLIFLIIGASALAGTWYQIRQARNDINKNNFDILWRLDAQLRYGKNHKISLAILHHRPVITSGTTEDDLDLYLSDLSSINEAYRKELVSRDDIYWWFYDYVIESFKNKEVRQYIDKLRKEYDDPEMYKSIDELYSLINKYSPQN